MSKENLYEDVKRLRKVTKLLEKAVVLLQVTQSTVVFNRAKAALNAAESATERLVRRKKAAIQAAPHVKGAMPCHRSEIFRDDGTLRFLSYMKPAGKRPAVIAVMFRVVGLPQLTTTFTLADREFSEVYEAAVGALVNHLGISSRKQLVLEMLNSSEAFSKRYGI